MSNLKTKTEALKVYHVIEVADEYVIFDYLSDNRTPGFTGDLEDTSDEEKKEILGDLKASVLQDNNKDYQGEKYRFNLLKEHDTWNAYSVRKLTSEIRMLEKVKTKYRFISNGSDYSYKYYLVFPNIQYSDGEVMTFDLCLPAQTDPDRRIDLGPELAVQIKDVSGDLLQDIAIAIREKYQIDFYAVFYINGVNENNILESVGRMKEAMLYMSELPAFKNTKLENLKELVL